MLAQSGSLIFPISLLNTGFELLNSTCSGVSGITTRGVMPDISASNCLDHRRAVGLTLMVFAASWMLYPCLSTRLKVTILNSLMNIHRDVILKP